MKHIKTTAKAESEAKKNYGEKDPKGIVQADEGIKAKVRELVKSLEEIDRLKLRASELKGDIMGFMKEAEQLKDGDALLCTWGAGNVSSSVDYDAIMAELKVNQELIDKFTVKTVGARRFSVEA